MILLPDTEEKYFLMNPILFLYQILKKKFITD